MLFCTVLHCFALFFDVFSSLEASPAPILRRRFIYAIFEVSDATIVWSHKKISLPSLMPTLTFPLLPSVTVIGSEALNQLFFSIFSIFACLQTSFGVLCMRKKVKNSMYGVCVVLSLSPARSWHLWGCVLSVTSGRLRIFLCFRLHSGKPVFREFCLFPGLCWRCVSEESCCKRDCGCVGSVLSTWQAILDSKIQK